MIIDTHCHLYWKDYNEDRDAVIERARQVGVERLLVVGTNLETSRSCFEICEGRPGLYPTAGIHPHDAEGVSDETLASIRELCARPECVGVGESGLAYFKQYSPREDQRRIFRRHLEWALELDKPIIIHARDAHQDTVELLRETPGVRGVMHCYTMGSAELAPYLEMGLYISFSGVVTYPKNTANREAAGEVPSDRLLVETDCPFLAPQGKRGKRNEPALVVDVLDCVARTRGVETEELALATTNNAIQLFGLA